VTEREEIEALRQRVEELEWEVRSLKEAAAWGEDAIRSSRAYRKLAEKERDTALARLGEAMVKIQIRETELLCEVEERRDRTHKALDLGYHFLHQRDEARTYAERCYDQLDSIARLRIGGLPWRKTEER
jgi:hypothetical protein